jgi:tRNA U34 5-methylaminomethyl-2-thiouridine-forming methyltransferase MnmC
VEHGRVNPAYQLVRLRNGAVCVRSLADHETFHPGIGPVAEAEALYVRQLRLPERLREAQGEFVIWDVGLGAAANALTALRLMGGSGRESAPSQAGIPVSPCTAASKPVRLVSFDHTSAALTFALQHSADLGYPAGFEAPLAELAAQRRVQFHHAGLDVAWTLELGDFPTRLSAGPGLSAPHAILFDPHSPQRNPAMWTASVFADLFRSLDPQRPCALATFTRSTMARATMLLAGFFVGVGHPSGLKEETTVAANRLELLDEPLDHRWLERAHRSDSAEPLWQPHYRRARLQPDTWERLQRHPQFMASGPDDAAESKNGRGSLPGR